MGGAARVRAILISPLVMYPEALLLMAARGCWTDNLEAVFAAPITALLFTLLDYPIAVVVLWIMSRLWSARPASFRVAAAITLALAAHFTLVWPLNLFHLPTAFMAVVVGVTALTWGVVHAVAYQRAIRRQVGTKHGSHQNSEAASQ